MRRIACRRAVVTGISALILLVVLSANTYADWLFDWRLTSDESESRLCNNAWCVGCDDSGNVHVVWSDNRDGNYEIYYKLFDGTSWNAPFRLTYANEISDCPSVAIDPGGTVHVVWRDYRDGNPEIYYKKYYLGKWRADKRLTDDPKFSGYPSLAIGKDGKRHLVWCDYRDGNAEVYYKMHDGTSWGTDLRLTSSPSFSEFPSVAVDTSGNAHVVWQDYRDGNYEIYYKTGAGTMWSSDERLTDDPGLSQHPSVAVDRSGNVHVVWQDNRDGNFEIYYKVYDGVTWSSDERLTNDAASSTYPTIAVDTTGKVYVVWQDDRDGNYELYCKTYDGTSWSLDQRVTTSDGDSQHPVAGIDRTGNVHLVWQDDRDGNNEIYWKEYYSGTVPTPEIASIEPASYFRDETVFITNLSGSGFIFPDSVWLVRPGESRMVAYGLRVESSEKIVCAIDLDSTAAGYWDVVVKNPGGKQDTLPEGFYVIPASSWSEDIRVSYDAGVSRTSSCNAWCVACDTAGNVHIVWEDERDGLTELYYRMFDGENWSPEQRLTNKLDGHSRNPNLVADAWGNLHLVWDDSRYGNPEICYMKYNGVDWETPVRLTVQSAVSEKPCVTVDTYGNVHVVWSDYRDGAELYHKIYDGTSWSGDERVTWTDDFATAPSIAADADGNLHLVWAGVGGSKAQIHYKMYDGSNWDIYDQALTQIMGFALCPSIAVDSSGRIHVVWKDDRDGTYRLYHKIYDGISWTTDELVTFGSSSIYWKSIAADRNGNIHLVYIDIADGHPELFYKMYNGFAWSTRKRLTFGGVSLSRSSITVDRDGDIHVVWTEGRDGNQEVYYKFRHPVAEPASVNVPVIPHASLVLRSIRPNPTSSLASIVFKLRSSQEIRLTVHDVRGRLVWHQTITDLEPGTHTILWNPEDVHGMPLSPGIYFVRIASGSERFSAKLVILR